MKNEGATIGLNSGFAKGHPNHDTFEVFNYAGVDACDCRFRAHLAINRIPGREA
jgi:hypothetical protein